MFLFLFSMWPKFHATRGDISVDPQKGLGVVHRSHDEYVFPRPVLARKEDASFERPNRDSWTLSDITGVENSPLPEIGREGTLDVK